jgi:gas vesicle protein
MKAFGKFLFGAMVGGIVGAVVAMIFAPASGPELRARLKSLLESMVADVKHAAEDRGVALREELTILQSQPPQE